jgi:guanine deaminase
MPSSSLAEERPMTPHELMAEAARLGKESVANNWGGPFGAVVARKGKLIARGQNRVLLTGDVTAHAEIEAIRKAIRIVNPYGPSISREHQNESTLELAKDDAAVIPRARMLMGMEIYSCGQPCPMCMGAIYWSRLDACYFGCDVEMTREIGFDDAFQYEDFKRPLEQRQITIRQISPEPCREAYQMWMTKVDRHYY